MNQDSTNEMLKLLRALAERNFGRQPRTPADFKLLSMRIAMACAGETVSESTLKRLWGYVNYPHVPNYASLTALARYVGFKDWDDFLAHAVSPTASDSGFLGNEADFGRQLQVGDEVRVEWNPDRVCVLRRIGTNEYAVVSAQNCKLAVGDTFFCDLLAERRPMLCRTVIRADKTLPDYVAGRISGLTSVVKITPED